MTSTNDGSNVRSGQKDKRYYIESFQSLEARLNGPASTEQRTKNVCEAWRLVHGLCSQSTADTRSHLISWIQRNTAYAILQDEWGSPENKPQHVELEKAINDFILECHETDTLLVWETTLLRRAVWYKGVLSNPWGHAVLKALLDPKGIQPTDQEVIVWLREERAMMFVTRLRVMARARRLIDLALVLVSAVMSRARRVATVQGDASHADPAPGVQGASKGSNFVETLSKEAGFTKDVWELLIDIEFMLLHKQDQSTCIDLAKKIPLKDGKRIVERLRFRLEKSPADKKLWKKAKDVAILIAQVVITRCMVVTSCAGGVMDALTGCASILAQLLDGTRLPQAAAALAAPAASAAHLYAFANAIAHQCKDKLDRQPFICELYVRAITAGMNELERLKLEKDKEPEVCALQHTLSGWFSQLGEVLSSSARLRCECLLTAFSLHPSASMYERVVALPPLATPDEAPKQETSEVTSEFGSWATDSRTSSNFVKTSETLNLKQTQKQTNILSSSMFDTECGALGLKTELCEDLAVLLSGPRVKTLSWDMDRELLLENCRVYKERTQEGTRALTTELKYLNLDPKSYDHLPEEEDDEDNYYGIEKGYELSLEYEEIWSDNNIDYTERCESACSISTVDSTKTRSKKNAVKYCDDESDPLMFETEANCSQSTLENSKNSGKKQNEVIKKKSNPKKLNNPDSKKLSEGDLEKELLKKQKRKERRERKKREKMEMLLKQELKIAVDDNATNLIGTKMLSEGIEQVNQRRKQNTVRTQHVSATDSDYDSQGKSSLASINSDGNYTSDVLLFDGLFSMDEIRSPERTEYNNLSATSMEQDIIKQKTEKQELVKDKLKNLLQFRHHKKQIDPHNKRTKVSKYNENIHSTSNIYMPEGIKSPVQRASSNVSVYKTTEPENLNNTLKRPERLDGMNSFNRKKSDNNDGKKNHFAEGQKQFQSFLETQAAMTSGLLISDPHQTQFQEFLKLRNIPITNNVRRQNQQTTSKVVQSKLAQRNPVLTGLIQRNTEPHKNVNSVKDNKNAPGSSNSEIMKLQKHNLAITESKKYLLPKKPGVDNVPNTFSRLSYMHKNKQADMKYKQLSEQEHSFLKINNLQAKGEIFISKTLKRNSMTINRDNPPPLIKQGERIPNPSTSAAMQFKDLKLNIVNVSKVTKEIVENKVIIKKDLKTTPVDLKYLIHQTNLDVGSNWKSQYPNTTIENSTEHISNLLNDDKVVTLGVANADATNGIPIQQENGNKVIIHQSGQYNSIDNSNATQHKQGEMENSEDWKNVLNKLRSLKSEKKGVDALEMTLNRNSSIKESAEILLNLHKYVSPKCIDSRDHIKQKVRTSSIDSKQAVTKNEIAQKSNQPGIVKKISKKVPKCNDLTKSLVISKRLKTSNIMTPTMYNSDYDQLDDLIDDELRQEIEESSPLNLEVDTYGSSRVTAMPEKGKPPKAKSRQEINSVQSNNINYKVEQTSRQSSVESVRHSVSRTSSVIKENVQGSALKPKLHIISDQILPTYIKSSSSKTEKYCTKSSENLSVSAKQPISCTQKIPCVTGGNVNNMSIITSPINIVHPTNVILRNVSHINQAQNLMLITPTDTIPGSKQQTPMIGQQLPLNLNVNNQTAYVLKPKNVSLFSSPQITANVLNPSIVGNAVTNVGQLCRNEILQSKDSKEYVLADSRTEVISQSNLNRPKLYEKNTKINSVIEPHRLIEEIIQSHSFNKNVPQYCDEFLTTKLTDGQDLPICSNEIRDCNIDIIDQPIVEKHFQCADETSNTNTKRETEFIHPNRENIRVIKKNEYHQNSPHLPKNVNSKESKHEGVVSKPNKTIASENNMMENNLDLNKEEEKSPFILSKSYDQILDAEFTKDLGCQIAKTKTDTFYKETERSPSILNESGDQIIDMKLTTAMESEITKTEQYKKKYLEICVKDKFDINECSKTDKPPKLEDEMCKPQEVKTLNKPIITDTVFENENNLITTMSKTVSYSDHSKPICMSLSVYIPQKNILPHVQENPLANAADITENNKIFKNKHSLDCKEIERLRNKRLSIIHREINHYIVSEPIALMYAPIQLKKSISNYKITNPIFPSQNNAKDKAEQRLKLHNKSNETTNKITSSEEPSPNCERIIDKSYNVPNRRLRSSNSFRTSQCTEVDEPKLSQQPTKINNTSEAKKSAPKRISENDILTDNSVMKMQKNELLNVLHNIKEIDVNNKNNFINQNKDEIHSSMHKNIPRNLNVIHSLADNNTIDLTETEPTNNNIRTDCRLLNSEPIMNTKNTISSYRAIKNVCKPNQSDLMKYHQPVHHMSQDISENNSKKEVTVTDIKQLPAPNGDITKKALRIKLSNGNIFRATVSGNLKVDIKTVLAEPSIKALLTTNILQRRSCTVNVKHVTDLRKNTNTNALTISSVLKRKPDTANTEVIELSDDEDENIYYFKTEFGTYKTKAIDSISYEKHKNKFSQKCTVQIQKLKMNMVLNSHENTLHNIALQSDIGSETKLCDVTNECEKMNDKITDYSETINIMEHSEMNSAPPYSETESISETLKNLQATLLDSQKVQLHNICRVNLARCDRNFKSNECCINSASVFKEAKWSDNSHLNEENFTPIIRSNSFTLLSDVGIIDEHTIRSESPSLITESQAKHGSILPYFDQYRCNSDWILCTKSTIYSLESKRINQQKYLIPVHDFTVKPDNFVESRSSFFNLSDAANNDKIKSRPGSPSIIADFRSQAKQSCYPPSSDQSLCNSDWILYTKATIHSLEVKQRKCVKTVLDLQVKPDIHLDSSTDCDSDLESSINCDIWQKNEEQNVIFQVPSLLSLVYTMITSNMNILERYIMQKNKKSNAFNSPTHNLKRKHNMLDKINCCKISKTDGNTYCDLNVPLIIVVDKKDKNTTTRELEHPAIVDENTEDGTPKFANLDETLHNVLSVSKGFCDIDSSNNNKHTHEENFSKLEIEEFKENNVTVNKTSREIQALAIKNNSYKIQLESDDQENKNAIENINEVPAQAQDIEKSGELKKFVETTIQYSIDSVSKIDNEANIDENVNNILSISKDLCETDYRINKNHECEENENNSQIEEPKERCVTINNTSRDMQIFSIKDDGNINQLKSNNQKSSNVTEYRRNVPTQIPDIERNILETTNQSTIDCMQTFATTSANEIKLDNNVDSVVTVAKVLCDTDSFMVVNSNNFNNLKCQGKDLIDNKLNTFYSNQHTENKYVGGSINNGNKKSMCSTEVACEMKINKNNEDTISNTLEITTIDGKSKFIPLTVSEKGDEIKTEYNLSDSVEVMSKVKELCNSEKLTQVVDYAENANDEKSTEIGNTIETKITISTPLKFIRSDSNLTDKSNMASDCSTYGTEHTLNDKNYDNLEQIVLEESFATSDIEILSDKLSKSSKCINGKTLEATMSTRNNTIETETYICHKFNSSNASGEECNHIDKDQSLKIKDCTEKLKKYKQDCANSNQSNEVANSNVCIKNSAGSCMNTPFFIETEKNNSENKLKEIHLDRNENTSAVSERKSIIENFTDNDRVTVENNKSKNEHESVTLIYKGNSNVVLKGSPYVDPVVGTCYIFPLSNSSCSRKELTTLDANQTINMIKSLKKKTLNDNDKITESSNYSLILPKVTYSRFDANQPKTSCSNTNTRQLKRKSDSKNDYKLEKKYRKGKNIDACKQSREIYTKVAYAYQYNRLLEYCTTIKFSYSRPFHKNSVDPASLLRNWPIQASDYHTSSNEPLEESEKLIFLDIDKENKVFFDPLQQTLAEEIALEYNDENEYSQFNQIEDSNFNMGFGEVSDRVIQNLANGIYTSNISAATLSDVKLPQPSITTSDKGQNIPQIIQKSNDEELAIMKRCISFIQLRDKVKDFFRKSASELHCNLNLTNTSSKSILYDLTSTQFFVPPTQVAVVNVVQVGQLPVSAAAQNPVTCDPRVTHVSNASPPQCSAENSPDGDQNASKTEYTELTTADLSLPLVQEYQQSSQVIMSSQSQLSVPVASKVSMDINCESKNEHKEEIVAKNENSEVKNNFLPEHKNIISNMSYSYNPENDSFKSGNNSYKSVNESYKSENISYKCDSIHKMEKNVCKTENNSLQSENSRTLDVESQNAIFDSLLKEDNDYVYKAKSTNGTSEKTDQIAHAMNAAGITTGTDSISNNTNNRAQALVNILSQKIRQNTVNTTQTSVNSYTKGSPINAMALQQALAQILPPPLNQTNSSDHQNSSVTPQVLHIVQGKNSSGNQITIVDNQQNSVINNSNNTPVLHIVQNKSATSNSNSATQNNNSFSGLSLVDAGIQQGGNQLLHIVNTGGQKNSTSGQLLKRVNLLTNLTNVQGNNEQKMVQFVCKAADGKSIQLNGPHQRSMVLRLQPIESTNVPSAVKSEAQDIAQSPNFVSPKDNNNTQQQEIKSRSVYEENYAKFIQNSSPKPSMPEKSTSLPKFNQAFGKQVFQDNNQKSNEMQSNTSLHVANTNSSTENVDCSTNDNAINLEHINQINSPPLLLRKSPAQTSQSQQGQSNLVQQMKQTMAPVNIQTMHGGVIYTRQIPVNIGGGQTINLITVPSTDLIDETGQKQQGEVKFVNQNEMEPSIIKIVPQGQNSSTSEGGSEDNNSLNATNDTPNTSTATHTQPVLTQMRIKLPMLSKTPQMVSGARLVRPSFFQIQRNMIGGANQPVYQQLVLTAAPSLGQQTVRPQAQPTRVKTTSENQTSSESQMSSSTLEQLREFDMVLEQVKERSTVQPNSNTNNTYTKLQSPTEATDSNTPVSVITTEATQQVLYSIGNNNSLNVAYVNRKPAPATPAPSTFARSPDSSGVADSPTSSTHVQIPAHSSSNETSSDTSPQQSQPKPKSSSKSKSRPKTTSNPTTSMKINTVPPKTSTQKPLEDEQTTQRILYILAEYKEQVENSPDKDKPAPRRRSNPPSNPGSSKRKKSSSGSRRSGGRDMSPIHGEDTCRTMGSEDSSCGTSQGDCTENCLETHSPQDSPRKIVRKLTFENETPNATPRHQPARNVIVADGQTITVARGTAGKPATAVLMPANYILPVSMVKGGQQIAIVTNRGPKILTVGGEGGGNALLLQRLIGPAGLKPVLTRPGVRHVRLPTAALHNLQAFNIATAANVQPPDSSASPAPAPTPPDLVETRATSSPWPDRDSQDVKPERSSSPEGSEPWNLPSSADPHDYSYEETVRAENLDRTVLDAIPDRYSPDLEAQRIFDKMFDVDTKKSYIDSQDNSPRCGYDIDASDCDDKGYQQVVQKRDQRQHRLVSAAALRHKYAMLEHELRLQKSLSEECEDLGVDSPSAAELFPEAELLFASSPAHENSHHGHTPQPGISQSTIPQPDIDDQIATDQLLNRTLQDDHQDLDVTLGLDEGIVTVSEDGMQATITLDQEEFARSHPNTTFHSEPTEEENVQPYTISGIKGRHITSTIFHAGRAPATVLMTAPQTTVISQAMPDQHHTNIKYIDNIMNPGHNNICLSSVLVKDDGLTKYDNILNDSRELHLSNTASAIVHSNTTQVIRRVCYDDDKRDSRFLLDETDALIAGDDAKMIAEDSSRDATLESIADDRSSPERHTELFWESNSASERSDSRRPLDFSSDSDKCCKSPLYDETNSTDSSGVGTHMRLDSVIKDARGLDRSGSADNSSADDTLPPLRTYPPKRMYHVDGEMERSVSGKTRAGERSPDGHEVRRRASVRGVVKRGCHCCNGSPAPPRPKKSRQKKPSIDFNN